MPMYITYPASSRPEQTGEARLANGPWPVVVFAHANNDTQCEIFDRYYSLHDQWASWGAVVVSVDSTLRNCLSGSRRNIQDRAEDQLWAVQTLGEWNQDPTHWLYQQLDLDRVVYAGHSRGGGSSYVAASVGGAKGVINLQGIDLVSFGYAQIRPDVPSLGVTAELDVDLTYPAVEPNEERLQASYTWVTLKGAIHAYTADTVPSEIDDAPTISRAEQHHATFYWTTAFLAQHVLDLASFDVPSAAVERALYSFDGAEKVRQHASSEGAFVRWRSDTPQRPLHMFNGSTPTQNELGGGVSTEGAIRAEVTFTYYPFESNVSARYAQAKALHMQGVGQWWTELPESTDVAGIAARLKLPDDVGGASFSLLIRRGEEIERVDGASLIGPLPLEYRYTQLWLDRTLEGVDAVGIELTQGKLLMDDLRLLDHAL
jgi:pimeloyl-ACP methyl ester carboxylesterase